MANLSRISYIMNDFKIAWLIQKLGWFFLLVESFFNSLLSVGTISYHGSAVGVLMGLSVTALKQVVLSLSATDLFQPVSGPVSARPLRNSLFQDLFRHGLCETACFRICFSTGSITGLFQALLQRWHVTPETACYSLKQPLSMPEIASLDLK